MTRTSSQVDTATRATELLKLVLGVGAEFRDGQLEAIQALVDDHSRVLVVERTGWGKSLVYFLATRLLREAGHGPTLLISPLLSLMRDQQTIAGRAGVRARSINSANTDTWPEIEAAIAANEVDLLIVSPERLSNPRFRERTLALVERAVGLFVVDEAHCISDWGHDFRPDYRRIRSIVALLPRNVPVLATTATANDRVVADIASQLRPGLVVVRGPLARDSLRLQTIELADQAERLAWLAEQLEGLTGSGVVYCLTVADCERVAEWLDSRGFPVAAYHGGLEAEDRLRLEDALRTNEVKALVATVALGMGFDKPDLGFVVHFQRPGSVVAYYQQIGRAGRALEQADVILLAGREDDEIAHYFINAAFPPEANLHAVLAAVEAHDGITANQIEVELNLSRGRVAQCLKVLEVDDAVFRQSGRFVRSANPWEPDTERIANVTRERERELEGMRDFVRSETCLMEFLRRELDDPEAAPCGRCAVCAGDFVPRQVSQIVLQDAMLFLRRAYRSIEPRKRWPDGSIGGRSGTIKPDQRLEQGRALSLYGDAGWGRLVRRNREAGERFDDELVEAAAAFIEDVWKPDPPLAWVVGVPSRRSGRLVPDFAERLAGRLGLPYRAALVQVRDHPPQREMANSSQQLRNVTGAFTVDAAAHGEGPLLLVDDVVDSRWSLTECGSLLRQAGSGPVYPFVLADSSRSG